MTRITHAVAEHGCTTHEARRVPITLPLVPGCEPDEARDETAPRQPMIVGRKKRKLTGAALRQSQADEMARRVQAIREALEAGNED